MGGAFGSHGHTGNVSPVAEANIANDPEAADIVFTASWPVTVIGLDVTQQVVMDGAYLDRLRRDGGEDGRFLYEVSRGYHAFHQRSRRLDGIFAHDCLAVIYALRPDLFTLRRGRSGWCAAAWPTARPSRSRRTRRFRWVLGMRIRHRRWRSTSMPRRCWRSSPAASSAVRA